MNITIEQNFCTCPSFIFSAGTIYLDKKITGYNRKISFQLVIYLFHITAEHTVYRITF